MKITSKKNYMDAEKLYGYMDKVWNTAADHGWHDHPLSMEHHLGLIMTEVAEAVEADRNNRRAKTDIMADVIKVQSESEIGLCQQWYETWFQVYYDEYIKGSIEEEFADIVIRILDMACERHGFRMYPWHGYDDYGYDFREDKTFVENAWFFIKEKLNFGTMNISDSVSYMYAWAEHLCINLDQQIEWKMKYNELRPYKHGGKKY